MIESVGRWFQDSLARVTSSIQDARAAVDGLSGRATGAAKEAADTAKDAARNAADTLVKLPKARVVTGRERCAVAPNGAPDCRAAAEAICRSHGFSSGSSLDMQSAQKCPARVWLSQRSPDAGHCEVESFVTRAACR